MPTQIFHNICYIILIRTKNTNLAQISKKYQRRKNVILLLTNLTLAFWIKNLAVATKINYNRKMQLKKERKRSLIIMILTKYSRVKSAG
jgi:hypothetical protein